MCLGRLFGDDHRLADVSVRQAASHKPQYLRLALGRGDP